MTYFNFGIYFDICIPEGSETGSETESIGCCQHTPLTLFSNKIALVDSSFDYIYQRYKDDGVSTG